MATDTGGGTGAALDRDRWQERRRSWWAETRRWGWGWLSEKWEKTAAVRVIIARRRWCRWSNWGNNGRLGWWESTDLTKMSRSEVSVTLEVA